MLQALKVKQARQIAAFAKAAREARDALLGNVAEEDLGDGPNGRGEHNPTASLGFDPLPADSPELLQLHEAINALTPEARSELFALMRIGQGDLAARNWDRGLTEAATLGDETVTAAIKEDPDLHDHVVKALYELKPAEMGG